MSRCITLNNGVNMPVIGFGVYLITGRECVECVKNAIQVGYRHIDSAQMYGNEREVGEGIRLSGVPRNQIFVTTKAATSGYLATKQGIEQSLPSLGIEEMARESAARQLVPIVQAFGFKDKDITITFRKNEKNNTILRRLE